MPKTPSKKYILTIGRRKSSIARLKLFKESGDHIVNGISIDKYFSNPEFRNIYPRPFAISGVSSSDYRIEAKVIGGGKHGQLDAYILALSRAIQQGDEKLRPALKSAGLLTVNSKVKERRKVGTGGKARRQKQSPKR